mgnify:CR=1 FL=1|jgi:hypothetical protein|tara:strand:- start:41 stop:250 length:210 start_codon:yes stop_codon:yes gene_type:complete
MKNKIEYILLKLVQITAIFYLPVLLYEMSNEPFSFGNVFWFGLDFALLIYFIEELLSKELERKLHGELY